MSIDTTIILYPERLFQPRGGVYDWAERVTDYFVAWSVRLAPIRSGELKASIWGDVDTVGPEELVMQIGASAEHAEYVVYGTDGGVVDMRAIGGDPGGGGYGRDNPGFARGRYWDRNTVIKNNWINGQDPQNFFASARYHVQGRYRSIGSWSGM